MVYLFVYSNYRLGNILRKTESRHVEFKTGGGNYIRDIFPEHIRKYGSAFLNSGGGQLCVGVTDKGINSTGTNSTVVLCGPLRLQK